MPEGYTLVDLESSPYDKPEKILAELETIEALIEKNGTDQGLRDAQATLKSWIAYREEQQDILALTDPVTIST